MCWASGFPRLTSRPRSHPSFSGQQKDPEDNFAISTNNHFLMIHSIFRVATIISALSKGSRKKRLFFTTSLSQLKNLFWTQFRPLTNLPWYYYFSSISDQLDVQRVQHIDKQWPERCPRRFGVHHGRQLLLLHWHLLPEVGPQVKQDYCMRRAC